MNMLEHPILVFLFVLANLSVACMFALVAIVVIPRRQYPPIVKTAGVLGSLALGGAHVALAITVLFDPDVTAREQVMRWPVLALHMLAAISMWVYLIGSYLSSGDLAVAVRLERDVEVEPAEPRPAPE